MKEKPGAFDKALSNFTFGMANKDFICHMAAEGYSVRQIKEATDYPVSVVKIAETVWEYYLETGVIRLNPPGENDEPSYDYVMDIGKFGKRSFRRVEVKDKPYVDDTLARSSACVLMDANSDDQSDIRNTYQKRDYIPLDIGIIKAHDIKRYEKMLDSLDSRKRDYIDGLPWPDKTVYHINNLAIREIMDIWSDAKLYP